MVRNTNWDEEKAKMRDPTGTSRASRASLACNPGKSSSVTLKETNFCSVTEPILMLLPDAEQIPYNYENPHNGPLSLVP